MLVKQNLLLISNRYSISMIPFTNEFVILDDLPVIFLH